MNAKAHAAKVKLSPDDGQRLRRLSEEIRGRLCEIALILTRSGGKPLAQDGSIQFGSAKRPVPAMGGPGDWMEITVGKDGEEACYGVIGGEPFYESPCGS
jgi:acyl-CoA reductase-like NAD-dependent aldehyde dehydrogenase